MSTLKVLKEYLVGDGGYLLNDNNNSKTVMLSGAWGSGKTHFWLEDIKPQLIEKKQKNIYISLYGRESIHELKFEVLREAYNLEVTEDFISKTASMISSIAPSLGEKSLVDGYDKLNKAAKDKKAKEILKSGSIICLDDFERKSKNIDLNDLFGYISQLALDYNCKVVIILNSDVFEGEEANVFKTVKEKTVNKFFYFEPERRELFDSIYDRPDNKYEDLDAYREDIFNAIDETEELNARIYIQVLDNCLEWIDKGYNDSVLRALTLTTIYFIKVHKTLDYAKIKFDAHMEYYEIKQKIYNIYPKGIISGINSAQIISAQRLNYGDDESNGVTYLSEEDYLIKLKALNKDYIFAEIRRTILEDEKYDEVSKKSYLDFLYEYQSDIVEFWKYGYQLFYMNDITEDIYVDITNFITTGILLKKDEEQQK